MRRRPGLELYMDWVGMSIVMDGNNSVLLKLLLYMRIYAFLLSFLGIKLWWALS